MNSKNFTYQKILLYLKNRSEIICIALGGSRSKDVYNSDSDYDIFCVTNDESFYAFRKNFSNNLEEAIEELLFIVEVYYLENWGYIFKGIDLWGIYYDISIIPKSRILEMGIQSTNIVLYDTDRIYERSVFEAKDELYYPNNIIREKEMVFYKIFLMNLSKFIKHAEKNDYWMMLRYLDRLKTGLMLRLRLLSNIPPKSIVAPDRDFDSDFPNNMLKHDYIIDGTPESLLRTAGCILKQFCSNLDDVTLLLKLLNICDKKEIFKGVLRKLS